MEIRIAGKYRLGRKIGSGSFGDIYIGTHLLTGEEVGIKLESTKTKHPQLLYESKIYKILQGGTGIPNIRWYGVEGDYNVMVIDLLGPSLEDLFNFCNRKFSLKAVLMLADQVCLIFVVGCVLFVAWLALVVATERRPTLELSTTCFRLEGSTIQSGCHNYSCSL